MTRPFLSRIKEYTIQRIIQGWQKQAERHIDEIREVRSKMGTKPRITLLKIWEGDVHLKEKIAQGVYDVTFQAGGNGLEILPPTTHPDIVCHIDAAGLWGLANSDYTLRFRNKPPKHFQPFTVSDAIAYGVLEPEGGGSLREMLLFEKHVAPLLTHLKLFDSEGRWLGPKA